MTKADGWARDYAQSLIFIAAGLADVVGFGCSACVEVADPATLRAVLVYFDDWPRPRYGLPKPQWRGIEANESYVEGVPSPCVSLVVHDRATLDALLTWAALQLSD